MSAGPKRKFHWNLDPAFILVRSSKDVQDVRARGNHDLSCSHPYSNRTARAEAVLSQSTVPDADADLNLSWSSADTAFGSKSRPVASYRAMLTCCIVFSNSWFGIHLFDQESLIPFRSCSLKYIFLWLAAALHGWASPILISVSSDA